MAVNPFYVGYAPEDVGRKYPGKGMARGYKPQPPTFDFDVMGNFVRQLEYETDIPRQLKQTFIDNEIEAIERAFRISANPGVSPSTGVTAEQMEIYEELGEEAALPGAMGISLEPLKILVNPKEALADTAKDWYRNLVNAEEVDLRTKTILWKSIMDGEAPPKSGIPPTPDLFAQSAVDAITARALTSGNDAQLKADYKAGKINNPLQMKNRGKSYGAENEFEAVGDSVVSFIRFSGSGATRDDKHDDFLAEVSHAALKEIEAKLPEYNGKFKDSVNLGAKIFENKVKFADSIGYVGKSVSGYGNVKTIIETVFLEGGEAWDADSGKYVRNKGKKLAEKISGVNKNIYDSQKALDTLRGSLTQDARVSFDKSVAVYEDYLSQLREVFGTAFLEEQKDAKTGKTKSVLVTDPTRIASEQVRRLISNLDTELTEASAKGDAIGLYHKLTAIGDGGPIGQSIGKGNVFIPGYLRQFRRDLIEGGLRNFGEVTTAGGPMLGDLIDELGLEDTKSLKLLVYRLQIERENQAFEEALKAIEKGAIWKTYIYTKRIRERFKAYTPAYWVETWMQNMHSLGFQIDNDLLYSKRTPGFVRALIVNNSIFRHRFDVEVNIAGATGTTYKVMGRGIEGRKQFSEILDVYKAVREGTIERDHLIALLSELRTNGKFSDDTINDLIFKLVGDPKTMTPEELNQARLEAEKFAKKLADFNTWLNANGQKIFGSSWKVISSKAENIVAFIQSLDIYNKLPGTGKITETFMGILDKIAVKLNMLQKNIFASKIMKFISWWTYLKTTISEAVADAAIAAIAAATGGIGTLAAPLRWLLRWIVTKTLDFFESVVNGIRRGDLSKVFKGVEKSISTFTRYALYIALFPLMIVVLAGFGFSLLLTAIPPVNLSRNVESSNGSLGAATAFNRLVECTTERTSLSEYGLSQNDATNSITSRAYQIVNNLNQGYWCFWNHSDLDYPALFNEQKYATNPNPSRSQVDGNDLFWCTWLVVKSYQNAGVNFGTADVNLLSADAMKNYFAVTPGYQYISTASSYTITQVAPGDAIFFYTDSPTRIGHVEIVYKVTDNYLITVGSNSDLKSHNFTVIDGQIQNISADMRIAGFGKKL